MALATHASEPNAINFKFALQIIAACSSAVAPAAAGAAVDSDFHLSDLSQVEPNLALLKTSKGQKPVQRMLTLIKECLYCVCKSLNC